MTCHVARPDCSGRNCIIPLMWRPNTDSIPNKPLTLARNQLLLSYVVTIRCLRYAVTLQVWTHLYSAMKPEIHPSVTMKIRVVRSEISETSTFKVYQYLRRKVCFLSAEFHLFCIDSIGLSPPAPCFCSHVITENFTAWLCHLPGRKGQRACSCIVLRSIWLWG